VGVFFSAVQLYSPYAGQGAVSNQAGSATALEGDTFDVCGGHAATTGSSSYHYHTAPPCLLRQLGATPSSHSPQLGWAADGFPVYGPRGPGGVLMQTCSWLANGAEASDLCTNDSGGYYAELPDVDAFVFRYYLLGDVNDGLECDGAVQAASVTMADTDPFPGQHEAYYPNTPTGFYGCCPEGADCTASFLSSCNGAQTTWWANYPNGAWGSTYAVATAKYPIGLEYNNACAALSCQDGEYYDGSICVACEENERPNDSQSACLSCMSCSVGEGFVSSCIIGGSDTMCEACSANAVSVGGESPCSECGANEVANDEKSACVPCPAGEYRDLDMSDCAACSGNSVSRGGGRDCEMCPVNEFTNDAKTACLPCSTCSVGEGIRLPCTADGNQTVCEQCGDNEVSTGGESACRSCAANEVADDAKSACVPCLAGEYRDLDMFECESPTEAASPIESPETVAVDDKTGAKTVKVTMGFSGITVEEFTTFQDEFVDFMAEEMGLSKSSITIVDVYIDGGSGRQLLAAGDLIVIFEVTSDDGISIMQFEEQIEEALGKVDSAAVNIFVQQNINVDAETVGEIAAGEIHSPIAAETKGSEAMSSGATAGIVIGGLFVGLGIGVLLMKKLRTKKLGGTSLKGVMPTPTLNDNV